MPLRFLYLEFSLVLQVLSSDVSDFEDSDDYASYLVGLFFMSLQVLPYMITSAVTRICYSSVRVVPAPTPAAPLGKHEASAYLRRYNIWYCVDLQQQEYAGIQDSEAPAGKPSAVSTDLTSEGGEDGFELSSFKSASASTSSPLHKSAKKASLASEKAAEKLVVLYTDEDIHRMFPADAQHHARRKADFDENSPAGANKTVAAAAAFSAGTVAAMDELRGEIASIKAAQAAAQAEARAAQEQLVALVKILADK